MPMDEKKGINTTELTLLIIGSTIGSGVFGITSDLATAAAPGPAILAWIIVGIGVLTLVLSLNNLSKNDRIWIRGSLVMQGLHLDHLVSSFLDGRTGYRPGLVTLRLPRLQ